MSDFHEALREQLEPTLVCPHCQTMNSPILRDITVDVNGLAYCGICGHGGPYQIFTPQP